MTPRGKNDKLIDNPKAEKSKENEKNQEKGENTEKDYDFRKLNELRWGVNKSNMIEVEQLPKEIDLIFQLKSENNVSILKSIPINFAEKRKVIYLLFNLN